MKGSSSTIAALIKRGRQPHKCGRQGRMIASPRGGAIVWHLRVKGFRMLQVVDAVVFCSEKGPASLQVRELRSRAGWEWV